MTVPRLTTLARLAAVALAAACLAACAAAGAGRAQDRPADTAVVVRSTGWMNGALETPASPDPRPATCPPGECAALKPAGPWLGTLGLRQLLPGNCEVGLGVAVPNPYGPGLEALPQADRFRDVGVGVWVQFEF